MALVRGLLAMRGATITLFVCHPTRLTLILAESALCCCACAFELSSYDYSLGFRAHSDCPSLRSIF